MRTRISTVTLTAIAAVAVGASAAQARIAPEQGVANGMAAKAAKAAKVAKHFAVLEREARLRNS